MNPRRVTSWSGGARPGLSQKGGLPSRRGADCGPRPSTRAPRGSDCYPCAVLRATRAGATLSLAALFLPGPGSGDSNPMADRFYALEKLTDAVDPLATGGWPRAGAPGARGNTSRPRSKDMQSSTLSSTLSTVVLDCATSICQRRRAVYGKCSREFEQLREFRTLDWTLVGQGPAAKQATGGRKLAAGGARAPVFAVRSRIIAEPPY